MNYNKIVEIVKRAGKIALDESLSQKIAVKGQADFVTEVDLKVNNYLKERLQSIDTSINFFSEEQEGELINPCWILDPIDGTTNLIYGFNLSSISLGYYKDGQIIFGIVYNPFTDECFTAEKGNGAWLNGKKKLKVSERQIDKALIEFGAGSTHKEFMDVSFGIVKDIFTECVDIRRICSSALDLCYIADGRIDGYFESILKPWDIAAGSLILLEAGGVITDFKGNEIQFSEPTSLIAGNGKVNNRLQKIIQKWI